MSCMRLKIFLGLSWPVRSESAPAIVPSGILLLVELFLKHGPCSFVEMRETPWVPVRCRPWDSLQI